MRPGSKRECYVGTDNVAAGRQAGELIKTVLPQGGKIMLFVGQIDARNAQERLQGIKETIAGTKIEILDVRTDDTDRVRAKANVAETLVAHPDVAALVGLWSYNGPAILNAVRDANKIGQVPIITFDEEDETLTGVKSGAIAGTVVQQPFEFGYQAMTLMAKVLAGRPVGHPRQPSGVHSDEGVAAERRGRVPEEIDRAPRPLTRQPIAPRISMGVPVLQLRNIQKRFLGVHALKGVSLEVQPGEVVALLGENGAGKSTLMKIAGGIEQPDSGEILLGGTRVVVRDVHTASAHGIAFIHQELNLLDNLDVAGNVLLGREPTARGAASARRSAQDARDRAALSRPARPRYLARHVRRRNFRSRSSSSWKSRRLSR